MDPVALAAYVSLARAAFSLGAEVYETWKKIQKTAGMTDEEINAVHEAMIQESEGRKSEREEMGRPSGTGE